MSLLYKYGRHTPVENTKAIKNVFVREAPALLSTSVMVVLCMAGLTGNSVIPHSNKDERTRIADLREQHLTIGSQEGVKIKNI